MAPDSSPTKSEPPTKDVAPDPTNAYRRLHITPLDQDLLEIVLPASVLPHARNISLHTLETFPEKRYGFVDLPLADAEKLKKRLNGTTLKGTRMRVEKARAEERREQTGHASDADAKTSNKRKAADGHETSEKRKPKRKPKRDVNVIEGVVLKDRKVKRGWTESTDAKVKNRRSSRDKSSAKDKDQNQNQEKKRKRPKSKYTDQDECLLKTRLPPNAVGNLPAGEACNKKKKKKKGRGGDAREIIVHEFEKTTTFPGFLKNEVPHRQGKEAVEFVDGKGWVDEDGNLVEAVEVKVRANDGVTKARPNKNKKPVEKKIEAQESSDDDSTSSSGTSSEEEDSDSDTSDSGAPEDVEMLQKGEDAVSKKDQSDASSGSSSDEDADADGDGDEAKEQTTRAGQEDSRPMSSSSSRSLTIQIPPPTAPGKVHPLEALYKRPKPDGAVALAAPAESFSFFAAGAQDDDDEDEGTPAVAVPMTPFTRQDLEWRNVRSAAPTPDTAHPSRMKNFWAPDDDEEDGVHEDEEGDKETRDKETRPDGQQGTSDFQSWFWENRRDLNKSWMARRKAAAKEKRHRENKSRASKAI